MENEKLGELLRNVFAAIILLLVIAAIVLIFAVIWCDPVNRAMYAKLLATSVISAMLLTKILAIVL